MNYLKDLFGIPDLSVNIIIYVSIIILLFITALTFMLKDLLGKTMSKNGVLSFRIGVIVIMLIMIPLFGKNISLDSWLFGTLFGAFIGATLFSTTMKKKDAIFILIYGTIGTIIAISCEKFL